MNNTFKGKLKEAMEQAQCTRSDLAAKTGFSTSSISQYLSGKNRPSKARVAMLEKVLGLPADYFTVRVEKTATALTLPDGVPDKITLLEAARYMGKSVQFVREGLKRGTLPFGYAVPGSGSKYIYFINPTLFFKYLNGDLKVNFQNGRITVDQAALLMGKSAEFIRLGLQQKAFPFGAAVQLDPNTWDYYISPKLFADFVGVELNDG